MKKILVLSYCVSPTRGSEYAVAWKNPSKLGFLHLTANTSTYNSKSRIYQHYCYLEGDNGFRYSYYDIGSLQYACRYM